MTETSLASLRPESSSLNLRVRVVRVLAVATLSDDKTVRCADVLVRDDSALAIFQAVGDQIDTFAPGTSVVLRNARTQILHPLGQLRVVLDPEGYGEVKVVGRDEKVETEEDLANVSLVEWEYVSRTV